MALLNEINVKGVPHPIVTDDGYYQEMTVGDAEQLVATQFVEDNEPYMFRPTGGSSDVGNRAYLDKIVGGTVAWNQLIDKSKIIKTQTISGVTFTNNDDGTITLNGTASEEILTIITQPKVAANHKHLLVGIEGGSNSTYYVQADDFSYLYSGWKISTPTSSGLISVRIGVRKDTVVNNVVFKLQLFDLTQMFGSTIADYIYSLEQSQAGAGVAWFKKLFPKDYYPYNAGELLSVEGLESHDTVGFNQWDEEWENIFVGTSHGNTAPSTTTIGSKNFCPILPSTAYYATCGKTDGDSQNRYYLGLIFYDENKQYISGGYYNNLVFTTPEKARFFKITTNTSIVVYGNTYNHDICINLSDPSRNGEYEPYEKHSYPFDNSLTLRGIPKLDASNNLYYDGDEYTSDGKVKRKYGVYTIQASDVFLNNNEYTNISYAEIVNLPNMLWSLYKQCVHSKFGVGKRGYPFDDASYVGELLVSSSTTRFWFGFAKGTTEEQMKSALDGTTIVYELATPTIETAEPFHNTQIVDDFGTEEFVSTGIVPVGHKTRYPANLRDKLQHLPSLANADGTYLIQQSGKQMHLELFKIPKAPTTDGTYVLKATVSGGTPTYVWEGVNAESEGE